MTVKLLRVVLFMLLQFPFGLLHAQAGIPEDHLFIGKWVGKTDGFEITANSMQLLHKSDQGWLPTHFAIDEYFFGDTVQTLSASKYIGWGVATYTARREYLVSGGEQSVEAVDFRMIKIESISKDKIKISFSMPYTITENNRRPSMAVSELAKTGFKLRPVYTKYYVLTKLNE